MTPVLIVGGLYGICLAIAVRMIVRAPYGYEIEGRGFFYGHPRDANSTVLQAVGG